MHSESDTDIRTSRQMVEEEPRDRTKWVWLGIIVLVAIMVVVMAFQGPVEPAYSTVEARHILIKADHADPQDEERALREITAIKKQIEEGADFSEMARRYSQDEKSAVAGGVLGEARKGEYSANFEEYVWNAPIGQLSDAIRTEHGYHLIVVDARNLTKVDQHLKEIEERANKIDPAKIRPSSLEP